jgi:putative oxidoreductase
MRRDVRRPHERRRAVNGPETVIAIGLLGLVLAITGSGRFGLDHLILRRRRSRTGA